MLQRLVLGIVVWFLGCDGADSQSRDDPAQCEAAADCRAYTERRVSMLSAPETRPRTLRSAVCERVTVNGSIEGTRCHCDTSNGTVTLGPKGVGCTLLSRSGGCLWRDSELDPCSVEDDQCPELCEQAMTRLAADADQTFDVEVTYLECRNGVCHDVMRVEDKCFADNYLHPDFAVDCSLSGPEVLKRSEEARNPPVPKCSGGINRQGLCSD